MVFTLAGRLRPYNKYLPWELREHPLAVPEWSAEAFLPEIERTLAGDAAAIRRTFAVVEREVRAWDAAHATIQANNDGASSRGGLTQENYTFSAPSPVEGGVRVAIEPRKREDMLVKGEMLLSPEGMLLRIEGDLVKRPSFWTKSVHLIRQYGRVEGTHVPLRIDIVAQVRLVGTSRLSMTYQYLEINGRPVQDVSARPR